MKLIPGTPLLGFAAVFDEAYGRPGPTPTVAPAKTPDRKLAPFLCPHCGVPTGNNVVLGRLVDPVRGHHWCPTCQGRFYLDTHGSVILGALKRGMPAPARVTWPKGQPPISPRVTERLPRFASPLLRLSAPAASTGKKD